MTVDLATLGIKVDASQTGEAAAKLDALAASGAGAQLATDQLSFSAKEFGVALKASGNDMVKATALLQAQRATQAGLAADFAKTGAAAEASASARIVGEQAAATAAVEGAVITEAAHAGIVGSSQKIRESLVLLREASVGNFTRMAGSASILLGAFGLINAVLLPVIATAAALGAAVLLATNQINEGAEGTGDLTRGLGLTADQLDKVKERYVTFGDTARAIMQELGEEFAGTGLKNKVQSVWDDVASIVYNNLILVTGYTQGAVNVIVEEWKRVPTALGGQGIYFGAGVDAAKAFKTGFDQNKADIDKSFSDIADRARTIATTRILKQAGNAPHESDGDHQIDSAMKQLAATQNQLKLQTDLNIAVSNGAISFAELTKQEKIDSEMKSIIALRDADVAKNTEKSRYEAAALTEVIKQLGPAYSALYDAQIIAKQLAANDNLHSQNLILEKQIELAGQASDARALEIAQYKTLIQLRHDHTDPNSSAGQAALGLTGDNVRRQQGVARSSLLNANVDAGTALGSKAGKATLASDPDNYIKQQSAAYAEIDKLRRQDVLSEKQAAQAKAKVDADISAMRLQNASDFFGNLSSLANSSNKELAAIGKAAAIAQATIDGVLAVQKALASFPPPINYVMAAGVGIAAAVNVSKIAGLATGGTVYGAGGPTDDKVLMRLSPGEEVTNAAAASRNRPLLKAINAGANFAPANGNSVGNGGPHIEINNYGTSKGFEVQQIDENRIRIIARDEDQKNTPKIMAREASTRNSPYRRALGQHTNIQSKMAS